MKNSSVSQQQTDVKQFTIFYAKRMENSSNPNKWRHYSQTFHNDDSQVCQSWIQTIQQQLKGKNYTHSEGFCFILYMPY